MFEFIKIQYPYDRNNKFYDGKKHEIFPTRLRKMNNSSFYILEYNDISISQSMVTIIEEREDGFYKIPLESYKKLKIFLNNIKLEDVSKDIIKNDIKLGETTKIEELYKKIQKVTNNNLEKRQINKKPSQQQNESFERANDALTSKISSMVENKRKNRNNQINQAAMQNNNTEQDVMQNNSADSNDDLKFKIKQAIERKIEAAKIEQPTTPPPIIPPTPPTSSNNLNHDLKTAIGNKRNNNNNPKNLDNSSKNYENSPGEIYICYDYKNPNKIYYFSKQKLALTIIYKKDDDLERIISKEQVKSTLFKRQTPIIIDRIFTNDTRFESLQITILPIYDKKMCEIIENTTKIVVSNENPLDNDLFSIINYGAQATFYTTKDLENNPIKK